MQSSATTIKNNSKKLDWVDGIKAFAIIAILLNHFAESFGEGPWFSSPSYNWPPFAERMAHLFPAGGSLMERIIKFLGWLGDMGPGVFILLSGLTLTLSALKKPQKPLDFYRKRLLRIYPLYITIHLIILVVAKFFFRWNIHLFSVNTFLSLLGLRFTDSLFSYINPSWWFIWVIIQMYVFFPFLLAFLRKSGARNFLLINLLITIICRLAGISGMVHPISLYNWMTGLFAGTRLFEFTFGMYLGYLLFHDVPSFKKLLNRKFYILFISSGIYIVGFVCSWTYIGSLFSHPLISIGLTGLFYSIYQILFKNSKTAGPLVWVGKNSFSVFLLHQPFMMYASSVLKGTPKAITLILIILLSFIAGVLIEKLVNSLVKAIENNRQHINRLLSSKLYVRLIITLLLVAIVLSFGIMLGLGKLSTFLKITLFCIIICIALFRINKKFVIHSFVSRFFDVSFIISSIIFLITENWFSTYWCLIILALILLLITRWLPYIVAVITILALLFGSISFVEIYLRKKMPIEVLQWGEYPALQMDSETIFSLKPDKTTHLKYNNYDYYVKTNSLGFPSEEINLAQKDSNEKRILIVGDAFSMPEGLDYSSSYPFLLEQALRKAYPGLKINVIDAGVTGYGPNEEYAQLKKYITIIKPDIVVNQFFVNEFDEINFTKTDRQTSIGFFVNKSKMQKYFANDQLPAQIDRFAQNKLGIINKRLLYSKCLLYYYETDAPYYDDSVIDKVNKYFDNMSMLCKQNGAKYIVMYVPGQIEVEKPVDMAYYPSWENLGDTTEYDFKRPEKITETLCAQKNISFIDTKPWLIHSPLQPVYFPKSWHWNTNGHKVVAEYLSRYFTDSIGLKKSN